MVKAMAWAPIVLLTLALPVVVTAGEAGQPREPQIRVFVTAAMPKDVVRRDEALPLLITIHNGLESVILHQTYRLEPTPWHGETATISLLEIYRNDARWELFLRRPVVAPPKDIAGMAAYPINPGASLEVRTDARKWQLRDGWLPGRYTLRVRVDGLLADDGRCRLSVLSDPVSFEIR